MRILTRTFESFLFCRWTLYPIFLHLRSSSPPLQTSSWNSWLLLLSLLASQASLLTPVVHRLHNVNRWHQNMALYNHKSQLHLTISPWARSRSDLVTQSQSRSKGKRAKTLLREFSFKHVSVKLQSENSMSHQVNVSFNCWTAEPAKE